MLDLDSYPIGFIYYLILIKTDVLFYEQTAWAEVKHTHFTDFMQLHWNDTFLLLYNQTLLQANFRSKLNSNWDYVIKQLKLTPTQPAMIVKCYFHMNASGLRIQ